MAARFFHRLCRRPAAGAAAGLWLCVGGSAEASPVAALPEAVERPTHPAGEGRWRVLATDDASLHLRPELPRPRLAWDIAAELLRHGVRYERPVSMADRSLRLGFRAPGKGSSIVTLEVKF